MAQRRKQEVKGKGPNGKALKKCSSGIRGFDEATRGGLPQGRITLVTGGPGCGKTLFATEFLVRGITTFDEPGVFVAFEESVEEIIQNAHSIGCDLSKHIREKKLVIDYIQVERSQIEETGEYDLGGLFIRLDHAISSVGAKRVVMDTLETLFAGLSNQAILRSELRRLFRWLKTKNVTVIITGENSAELLRSHGLEEFVSDCVVILDHRVRDQISTRRLRILKYRGSAHGTNEYPFYIDDEGFSVLPITSMMLDHPASHERVSSGVRQLDEMLDGKGFFRGSTVLVSGTAGTGKTSLSAHFADAVCKSGDRCLYFAFEESHQQLVRNMRAIGIDLERWIKRGLLRFYASRPTLTGLEVHLGILLKLIQEHQPDAVIVDPVSSFMVIGSAAEANAMLLRLVDHLKSNNITGFFTNLTTNEPHRLEQTDIGISSVIDTWLLLREAELDGERRRFMYVLKSRGMAHSKKLREFDLTDKGLQLFDENDSRLLRQESREPLSATMTIGPYQSVLSNGLERHRSAKDGDRTPQRKRAQRPRSEVSS